MIKTWLSKNKVIISGSISAAITAVIAFTVEANINWILVLMAVIQAVGGYLGRNLRGQAGSIVGLVVGMMISVLPNLLSHIPIDWQHELLYVVGQVGVIFFGLTSPPAKSLGYEKTDTIIEAKIEGEAITKEQNK